MLEAGLACDVMLSEAGLMFGVVGEAWLKICDVGEAGLILFRVFEAGLVFCDKCEAGLALCNKSEAGLNDVSANMFVLFDPSSDCCVVFVLSLGWSGSCSQTISGRSFLKHIRAFNSFSCGNPKTMSCPRMLSPVSMTNSLLIDDLIVELHGLIGKVTS